MAGPLEGIRVLDFGQYLAGPFGPMVMADLGADVIKVEPTRGDGMRGTVVGSFMGCQRGKRNLALDLKSPEGLEIALELVATADVVHHNMTLGTADKLGLSYEACRAVKADVIYCNTFMYGPVGPLAHMGGLDPLGQAAAGLEWEQGPVAEGNPPLWLRYGHGDVASAMPSASAVLMALWHRNRTGEGQFLWTSLLHGSMLYTLDSYLLADGTPSPRPLLDKEQLGLGALYRLYPTTSGWLQLAAVRPRHWPALCGVLGLEDLVDDPRFSTPEARENHRAELTELLADAFAQDLASTWKSRLLAAGVPAELSVDQLDGEAFLFDAEMVDLGLVTSYQHPILGTVRQAGNLITFEGTPATQERATGRLGEDSLEVLAELGKTPEEIDGLLERRVTAVPGDDYPWPV
jgi:crotonobetainyl-CoA:carnitine CoA-transferase CaiB-like acyl-CoA transferase